MRGGTEEADADFGAETLGGGDGGTMLCGEGGTGSGACTDFGCATAVGAGDGAGVDGVPGVIVGFWRVAGGGALGTFAMTGGFTVARGGRGLGGGVGGATGLVAAGGAGGSCCVPSGTEGTDGTVARGGEGGVGGFVLPGDEGSGNTPGVGEGFGACKTEDGMEGAGPTGGRDCVTGSVFGVGDEAPGDVEEGIGEALAMGAWGRIVCGFGATGAGGGGGGGSVGFGVTDGGVGADGGGEVGVAAVFPWRPAVSQLGAFFSLMRSALALSELFSTAVLRSRSVTISGVTGACADGWGCCPFAFRSCSALMSFCSMAAK